MLPHLRKAGLSVSTIKHAHHGMELDRPGKDSFRHREAGASEVLVVGGMRWALLHELPPDEPDLAPDLLQLSARLEPVDLVLVEGFKAYNFPKIEVFRPSVGKPPLWLAMAGIVAVATDEPGVAAGAGRPPELLPLNDAPAIARWIAAWAKSRRTRT